MGPKIDAPAHVVHAMGAIPIISHCNEAQHPGIAPRRRRQSQTWTTQYVARPPETSNTAPVEKEHSSEASQATNAATSSARPTRPIGIFDFT